MSKCFLKFCMALDNLRRSSFLCITVSLDEAVSNKRCNSESDLSLSWSNELWRDSRIFRDSSVTPTTRNHCDSDGYFWKANRVFGEWLWTLALTTNCRLNNLISLPSRVRISCLVNSEKWRPYVQYHIFALVVEQEKSIFVYCNNFPATWNILLQDRSHEWSTRLDQQPRQ